MSAPLILDVLEKIDVETAYRLLENEEMPGGHSTHAKRFYENMTQIGKIKYGFEIKPLETCVQ